MALLKGGPPPVLLIEGQLCRMFNCLPSQLRAEGADILKMARMLEISDQIATQDAEAASRRGANSGRRR